MIQCTNYKMMFEDRLLLSIEHLTFEKGKLHLIKGENGSGKTTLIRSIIGWIKPSDGQIIMNGTWTYQPQIFHLFNPKVKENFKQSSIAEEYLRQLNCENFNEILVSKLSGGERQKIALVRTLCEDTDVYLLDEPTSYMDEVSRNMAYELIQKVLLDNNKTVLLIAHDNVEDYFKSGIQYTILNQKINVDKTW